jgi:hypothetical protein
VRNYRDYKRTDFDLAFTNWIWGINRGILCRRLDEQWLVSRCTPTPTSIAASRSGSFVDALVH